MLLRICKTLAALQINIEEIRLTPIDRLSPHGRQAIDDFELSIRRSDIPTRMQKRPKHFPVHIENRLRELLGVVSASVKWVDTGPEWKRLDA